MHVADEPVFGPVDPDVDRLAGWIEASYAELREAAELPAAPPRVERKLRRVSAQSAA